MRKNLFFMYFMAAVLGLSFTACSDDDGNGGGDGGNDDGGNTNTTALCAIVLDMPLNVENPTLTSATATLTNVSTNVQYTLTNFRATGTQYSDTITVPSGVYNVAVEGEISYNFDDNNIITATVKNSSDNVTLTAGTEVQSKTLALNTYKAQEGLVITEIFFTGTLTPEGKQYSDDQYFKIGNNSDETLYLDGVAIVESDFMTVSKYDYTPDIMDKAMTVDAVYCFPGSGTDYPIEPGAEVVVALNAKNHKELNSNSIDLSTADFEFYDESENPSFTDDDNPNVTNLVNWYDYSASYFGLHNRGFKSYAIARPTVDVETFMTDYHYTYTYVFTYGEYSFDMDGDAFMIPNDWILDAVNLSVESDFQWIVTSASLDAGWTHCGSVDHDQSRYNKAVVRKQENGKWVDTNNSTNDFEADATPTLLQ